MQSLKDDALEEVKVGLTIHWKFSANKNPVKYNYNMWIKSDEQITE